MRLENVLPVLAGLHWHGMTEPWRQDGVPYLSGPPIAPGAARDYRFPAIPPGTRWMHSHFGLQEQNLLAAPLIIREASAIRSNAQEVVLFLEDFSWTSPSEIFEGLRNRPAMAMAGPSDKAAPMAPDLNDVEYDAYLANDRTLDDPDVIQVERNGEVRLRVINAGASTNFTIDLGNVQGTLVAVDGNPIVPVAVRRVPMAIAQRADIILRMPPDGTAAPILALGEGRRLRTGIILQPPGATVAKISADGDEMGPQVGLEQELQLVASAPLPAKAPNRSIPVDLTGNMMGYVWGMPINGMPGLPGDRRPRRAGRDRFQQHDDDVASDAPARACLPGRARSTSENPGRDPRHHSRAAKGDREGGRSTQTIPDFGRSTATISTIWRPACSRRSSIESFGRDILIILTICDASATGIEIRLTA